MDGTFVGRVAAQAVVESLLDRARQGCPQPLAVLGAAGLGKTTMIDRLAEAAQRSGFRCVVVRADRADADVPFSALRLAVDDALRDERDPSLVPLAAVLHDALAAPPGPAPRRQVAQRQVALDALRRVVEGWAFHSPVLVALDDLHVADRASASAVLFLMRHIRRQRVLVAVATRADPYLGGEVAADLERFERTGVLEVMRLEPLDEAELVELVRRRFGTPPAASLARMLAERSGGVPFFAVELLDLLAASGALAERDGELVTSPAQPVLPRRVSTAVLHRVFQLGPDARAVATVSAALGRVPLGDLAMLADLARLDRGRTEAAFDALVRAEVLVSGAEGYHFAHAIVREAVYEDLGPAARRRLHSEIAGALAGGAVGGAAAARYADVVEIAGHVRRAGGGVDRRAATLLGQAGDAVRDLAPARAAEWYREALTRLDPAAPDAPRLGLRLSRALDLAHAHRDAAVVARGVLASATGDDRRRALVATAQPLLAAGRFEDAGALLDEALADPGDPAAGVLLLRALVQLAAGRPHEATRCLAEVGTVGGAGPSDRLLALGIELHLACGAGDHGRAASLSGSLRSALDAGPGCTGARLVLCAAEAFDLDPTAPLVDVDRMEEGAPLQGWFRASAAWAAYRSGLWDEALSWAATARAATEVEAGSLATGPILAASIAVLAERGDVVAADRAEQEAVTVPIPTFRSGVEVALALLHRSRGRHGDAEAVLRSAERRERDEGRLNGLAMVLAQRVEAAVDRGDPAGAHAANDELQTFRSGEEAVALTMRRLLARALVDGDDDAAVAAREYGDRYSLAVDVAQATGLLGAIRSDADLLAAAYVELGRLGAALRQRPVARALRRLGRRVPTGRGQVDGLRPVEVDIVGLVAAGLSNRQIGQRTGLSPKTIEVYLSRIYAKTGHRSRVELAVASRVGRLGRVEPVG